MRYEEKLQEREEAIDRVIANAHHLGSKITNQRLAHLSLQWSAEDFIDGYSAGRSRDLTSTTLSQLLVIHALKPQTDGE